LRPRHKFRLWKNRLWMKRSKNYASIYTSFKWFLESFALYICIGLSEQMEIVVNIWLIIFRIIITII
jgi:hypothetical protein